MTVRVMPTTRFVFMLSASLLLSWRAAGCPPAGFVIRLFLLYGARNTKGR
jgi:hypothetical protein